MALTPEQRAELEALRPETVRIKLIHGGPCRGAMVLGFKTGILGGNLTRGDIDDWLVEKGVEEVAMQRSTLRWAKIAGIAAIVSVIVSAVGIWLAK